MKVLAINGSAREDGNTAILINTVFEELHKAGIETEMVQADGIILGSPVYTANVSANMQAFLERASVVGSSYWAMAYGQMPGDVQKDEEGLDTMKNLGQNMAYLLNALKERRAG